MQLHIVLQSLSNRRLSSIFFVVFASLLIGLCGSLAIPLPFTPVPIALRPMVILGLSSFLGGRGAAFAVLGFLFQAAVGLPVLAGGALSLLGPTGGYCLGYLAAAYAVGTLSERSKGRTALQMFAILSLGSFLIYLFGALHLATFVGWDKAFWLGVAPFLLGDLFKTVVLVQMFRWMRWIQE